jgi:hypothetical protein
LPSLAFSNLESSVENKVTHLDDALKAIDGKDKYIGRLQDTSKKVKADRETIAETLKKVEAGCDTMVETSKKAEVE